MRDKVKMLLHRIAHRLERNTGKVWTGWVGDRLMVGFQCDICGQIDGVSDSGVRMKSVFPKTAEQEVGRE